MLSDLRGYSALSPQEKLSLQMPYIHTTLLINELVKLQHDESGGKIRVYERSGMRKDRYSSLSYSYYVATQLERKSQRRSNAEFNIDSAFIVKLPKSILRKGGGR